MKRFAVFAATLATLSGSSIALAVPLLNGFGGPTGYGLAEHCVHPSDDGSWSAQAATGDETPTAVDLRGAFPAGINWFGQRLTTMFVNVNGNVTFRAPLASPIPVTLPQMGVPMMAPFWADADTRGGEQPARNNVCFHTEPGRVRGQRCADGRCRDLCEDFPCANNQVCELDPVQWTPRCVAPCQCRPCSEEQVCAPDGHCVDRGCREPCPTGSDCVYGRCIDRCTLDDGARPCAPEEVCARGRCVPRSLDIAREDVDAGLDARAVPEGGCACKTPRRLASGHRAGWLGVLALFCARRRPRQGRAVFPVA